MSESAIDAVAPAEGDAAAAETAAVEAPQVEEPQPPGLDALIKAAEANLQTLLRGVTDAEVLKELADLADSDSLERLVQRGKPPSWQKKKSISASFSNSSNNANGAYKPITASQASKTEASTRAKNFGNIDGASLAMGGAGSGGGLGLNRPGAGPKVQHFAGGGGGSGRGSFTDMIVEESIREAWIQVQNQDSPVGWLLCTYAPDGKSLQLKTQGNGLKTFKDALGDELAWAGFRCWGVDKRGGVECRRPKFVNVQYKPDAASAIKKAKMASHKGAVKAAMVGTHLDVVVENIEHDLAETALIERLQAATGAHKPNGYEFDEGVFVDADFYGLGIGTQCKGESHKS